MSSNQHRIAMEWEDPALAAHAFYLLHKFRDDTWVSEDRETILHLIADASSLRLEPNWPTCQAPGCRLHDHGNPPGEEHLPRLEDLDLHGHLLTSEELAEIAARGLREGWIRQTGKGYEHVPADPSGPAS